MYDQRDEMFKVVFQQCVAVILELVCSGLFLGGRLKGGMGCLVP